MRKAREVHAQLLDLMQKQHKMIPSTITGSSWDVIRKAICSAYFYNSSKMKGVGEYINMLTGIPSSLHPSSALFGLGYTPEYVCYHELISTSKEYMSCVTAIEGEWLAEAGPMFFSIKESYESTLVRRQKEFEEQAKIDNDDNDTQEEIKSFDRDGGHQQSKILTGTESSIKKKNTSSQQRSTSSVNNRSEGNASRRSVDVKFMPKKRRRVGL